MKKVKLIYVDDKIDLYVSRYLLKNSDILNYDYEEITYNNEFTYENFLESEIVQKSDIIILDSMLFENNNSKNNKITGEELGVIIKKIFPFKEILIITQNQDKSEYCDLNKFNSKSYENNSDSFFEKRWLPSLEKAIAKISLNQKIMKNIKMKDYMDTVLYEKIYNSICGISIYDELKESDINNLIKAFQEMRDIYEKRL
jgi:putative type II DNA methylase protein